MISSVEDDGWISSSLRNRMSLGVVTEKKGGVSAGIVEEPSLEIDCNLSMVVS